ncbi:MAG: hypothetical protein A3G87_09895 [Omnitrophica bacterium RIFCSPLOWO2_12_FULL_50_11]|nr:MAG: hypothetical protein A3G87_09895 [Omnitrophica bacterium RIFCSPLOWO2_12_FULL_50_11]
MQTDQPEPPPPDAPQSKSKLSLIRNTLKSSIPLIQNTLTRLATWVRTPKHLRVILIVVGVLIVLAIVRGIFFPRPPDLKRMRSDAAAAQRDVVGVKVFKVGRFNFEDSLKALGTIKGIVEFKLSFEIPGVISAINYREGEYYEEGALLISLKQDDFLLRLKRSQAQQQKALAALKIAEDKWRENKTLFEIGAVPQTTLDRSQLEVDQAKYEHEAAAIEMKANEVVLEKSNLYAPSAGAIGELNVEEGEAVTPNTLVGSHVRTDRVSAEFGVTQRDLNKVSLGQKAKVYVDTYPDRAFEGVVENIAPVIGGPSRTANVRVRIENPESLLLPGMSASIKILLYQKRNTLIVPIDALLGKEHEQYVYVVDPQEKTAVKTPVVVGYSRVDYAQIDSGVREGDLVVVSGMDRLEEGTKVRIIETQEGEL